MNIERIKYWAAVVLSQICWFLLRLMAWDFRSLETISRELYPDEWKDK